MWVVEDSRKDDNFISGQKIDFYGSVDGYREGGKRLQLFSISKIHIC